VGWCVVVGVPWLCCGLRPVGYAVSVAVDDVVDCAVVVPWVCGGFVWVCGGLGDENKK